MLVFSSSIITSDTFSLFSLSLSLSSAEDPNESSDLYHDFKFLGVDFELTLGPYVEMSTKLGVILDFDGTLSYLAPVSSIVPSRRLTIELVSESNWHTPCADP